jgi:hypothetical protein
MPTQKFIKILSSFQNIMEFDQLLGSNCARQQPVGKQQRYFSIGSVAWFPPPHSATQCTPKVYTVQKFE